MCSCSGSCNCNSTTIPRGPQGAPGPSGNAATIAVGSVTALPAGSTPTVSNGGSSSAASFNFGIPAGATGTAGLNAFTTLTDDFVQPAVDDNNTINVLNSQWMAIDEIIYIGPAPSGLPTNAGGFYRVFAIPNSLQVTVINLGWTIPGITFVAPASVVGAVGTIVTPSGTIGATGETGPAGASVIDAKWGNFQGSGGANDFKTSISIPGNSLVEDYDELECQTIFKVFGNIPDATYVFYIKVGVSESNTDVTAIQFNIPIVNALDATNSYMINMNYKIQKIGSAGFRSKGECFVSDYKVTPTIAPFIFRQTIAQSFLCNSTNTISLTSSNWTNELFVSVLVDDVATPKIYVTHHEVKLVKKSV